MDVGVSGAGVECAGAGSAGATGDGHDGKRRRASGDGWERKQLKIKREWDPR